MYHVSFCLPACLSICLYLHLSICLFHYLSVCLYPCSYVSNLSIFIFITCLSIFDMIIELPIYQAIQLYGYLTTHLSIHLFDYLYVYLAIYLTINKYASIFLMIYVPIYLFICPSINLCNYISTWTSIHPALSIHLCIESLLYIAYQIQFTIYIL